MQDLLYTFILHLCASLDSEGYPGNYRVGCFYCPGKYPKFINDVQVSGNYSYYFQFDQMIYRKYRPGTTQGLTPWIALVFAQKNRNLFPFFYTTGLVYKGIIPNRDHDTAAFGAAYGKYSSDLRQKQRAQGKEEQHYELDLELNYRYQVTQWFFIQPDVQYILNPKGYKSVKNALVIGAQSGITF